MVETMVLPPHAAPPSLALPHPASGPTASSCVDSSAPPSAAPAPMSRCSRDQAVKQEEVICYAFLYYTGLSLPHTNPDDGA
jgi:hypothetical protein